MLFSETNYRISWPIPVPRGAQIDCQIEHSERMGSINEAWHFLSNHASQLAERSNIAPEDLILSMY